MWDMPIYSTTAPADQRNDQPLFADGVGDGDADVVHIGQCSLKTGFVDDVYQRLLGDRRSHRMVALLVARLTLT